MTTEQRSKDLKNRVGNLLVRIPVETIGKRARREQEHELSCLSLLASNDSIGMEFTLCLDIVEKMKKEIKGKRWMLDQETSNNRNLVSLLEDDAEYEFVKEKDPFVIYLEKIRKWRKSIVSVKEANIVWIIKNID